MPLTTPQLLLRGFLVLAGLVTLRALLFPSRSSSSSLSSRDTRIRTHNVVERFIGAERPLDVQKYPWLQSRVGRDARADLFDDGIRGGLLDFWHRFQRPFMLAQDTAHIDNQVVRGAVDDLLAFNGWVAAACPHLTRPFGQNKGNDDYSDLADQGHLYYVAIIVHSADHFIVDQLAVIVQLARRLGVRSLFVSILDFDSQDSTPTLADLCESVLLLLGIPFRIRRVPPMTVDPTAGYYPLEEAHARNLALEPLHELYAKRSIKFHRVVWLKGFTCPNDVLENLRVSIQNDAAMVCGMDWAEHNGFFIFSDRWRTRDIEGALFRQAKSNSKSDAGPPRDAMGTKRYAKHLPFQAFCCESGTHVVDPAASYYRNIAYRAAGSPQNLTHAQASTPEWDPESACMDSAQMYFCRDVWVDAASEPVNKAKAKLVAGAGQEKPAAPGVPAGHAMQGAGGHRKARREEEVPQQQQRRQDDLDGVDGREKAAGGGVDEVNRPELAPEGEEPPPEHVATPEDDSAAAENEDADSPSTQQWVIPNSSFRPARILVNPRCVTTYGGVSHTQLALDLFGQGEDVAPSESAGGKYVLENWEGAPESYVCQEMRTTGGRTAPKSQRRVGFSLQAQLGMNWG